MELISLEEFEKSLKNAKEQGITVVVPQADDENAQVATPHQEADTNGAEAPQQPIQQPPATDDSAMLGNIDGQAPASQVEQTAQPKVVMSGETPQQPAQQPAQQVQEEAPQTLPPAPQLELEKGDDKPELKHEVEPGVPVQEAAPSVPDLEQEKEAVRQVAQSLKEDAPAPIYAALEEASQQPRQPQQAQLQPEAPIEQEVVEPQAVIHPEQKLEVQPEPQSEIQIEAAPQPAPAQSQQTQPVQPTQPTAADTPEPPPAPVQQEPVQEPVVAPTSVAESVKKAPEAQVDKEPVENLPAVVAETKGRLGERLVQSGAITEDQLAVALQEKRQSNEMLGKILVDLGFIAQGTLSAALAEASGFSVFDPLTTIIDNAAKKLIDRETAEKHSILPVSVTDKEAYVVMSDPYDVVALDTIRKFLPKNVTIRQLVTTPHDLSVAIDNAYGYATDISEILEELEELGNDEILDFDAQESFTHPIIRLVNALVFDAVKLGASDIHIEPEENFIRVRYRLDGVLFTSQILHKQYWSGISQRVKILCNMNIADKLSPQDGRFQMNVGGRSADFRVSSLPTVHGENIVLRILDKTASIMPLDGLGFSESNMEKIRRAQSKPEGIIIVTGPTGSGKTTSLYSMLNEINTVDVNIQTLEDPVEYSLPMIRQTHVREGVLEFADGIKAMLRQDPDIIFIGEIRDGITANMALKAAMTGHQVYTTLHTNDSFGAIPRIFDLGLKPGMVAGAIVAVFAQRLTRRVCHHCRVEHTPNEEECKMLGVDPASPPQIYKANIKGCESCGGKGYRGRVAIAEILSFNEELDEVVAQGGTVGQLKAVARKQDFKSMRHDGMEKVLEGITTLEALAKVVDIRGGE